MKKVITEKQQRRRYKLHYLLRKNGHTVCTGSRHVIKKATDLTKTEEKYLAELVASGYGVSESMFKLQEHE